MAYTPCSVLATAFNALPQDKGRSGLWHFDLRYNPLEPNPHHLLVCVQVHGGLIHVEPFPLGFSVDNHGEGIEFFPESAEEAAPEIARAILYVFVHKLNTPRPADAPDGPVTVRAPSKMTMRDRELLRAVGRILKTDGVRPDALHDIAISSPNVNELATLRFAPVFEKLKKEAGYKGTRGGLIPTPESIVLWNFKLDPCCRDKGSRRPFPEYMDYVRLQQNTAVPLVGQESISQSSVASVAAMVKLIPEETVKDAADEGDPYAAFDYAMRLYVGLECSRNRTLARYCAVQAALDEDGPPELRAAAHAFLLEWCIKSSITDFRTRYVYAATHHANMATILCREAATPEIPLEKPSSPLVLGFMRDVFMKQVGKHPDLRLFCKEGIRAMEKWDRQMEAGKAKLEIKKLKTPLRYRCAAIGCGIEADKGKMLSQCAGKCDADKKPSYCSKECQKGDWKNHKPFCFPGAECSVIDDDKPPTRPTSSVNNLHSGDGALQVPITLQDGSTTYVSSSTLDAQTLKEIRGLANGRISNVPFGHSNTIERFQ